MINLLSKVNRSFQQVILTASNPCYSDLYIVEYPKSGVTWLSILLANSALISSNRLERATFSTKQLYVPDIHINRHICAPVYDTPPQRMIKSHSLYNKNYIFVIYLVRHPFTVMQSFYTYLIGLNVNLPSFEEFIFTTKYGLPAWKKHINSWLNRPNNGKLLYLVRYEDMIKDPNLEIDKISQNLGWNLPKNAIDEAVKISSKEVMSRQEYLYAKHNPRYSLKFVGSSMQLFMSEDERDCLYQQVEDYCASELKLLGYM